MLDVVIISLPRLDLTRPLSAPAMLKNMIQARGQTAKVFDYAMEVYKNSSRKDWDQYELYWQIDLKHQLADDVWQRLNRCFDDLVSGVLSEQPSMICLSVFSHNSIMATNLFLKKLRPQTKAKIVIGGAGINSNKYEDQYYGKVLLDMGLIDFYCAGEAETTFNLLLDGATEGAGINNYENLKQMTNIDEMPVPDYSDYNISEYHHLAHGPSLWINGSRGCVRNCDFCDVPSTWKKFTFRAGECLADEMLEHYEKSGVSNFQFTDNLMNGSISAFNNMADRIVKYIDEGRMPRPSIGGFFIIRPKNQVTPKHYKQWGRAGIHQLITGLETGSDSLRHRMGKRIGNTDILYHLEQCKENGIKNMFLFITGHPTETLHDHQQTLWLLKEMRRYLVSDSIAQILALTVSVPNNTPLWHWCKRNGIKFGKTVAEGDNRWWYNPALPDLTLRERVRRQLEVYETAMDMGYPVTSDVSSGLRYSLALLEEARDSAWEYY